MKAGIRKQDNSACNFAEYIERNARTVLKDCNNTRLSNVVGAGEIWKDFISQTTRRLNAADFGKDFSGSPAHPHAGKTFFVLMYVDNVGGASFNDLLYDVHGMAVMGWLEGTYQHMRRADMHMKVALTVMNQFGHVDSLDKRCSPSDAMVFLGVRQ